MLDLRRLHILREVARLGSFTQAAGALSYSQPAVSQQIAKLERELGIELVRRKRPEVELTEAGRTLVAHADAVLARLEAAEAEMREIERDASSRLRVGVAATVGAGLITGAAAPLLARGIQVSLVAQPDDPDPGRYGLAAGRCDVVIAHGLESDAAAGCEELECVPLRADPLRIVMPLDHPCADVGALSLARFADERWIVPGHGSQARAAVLGACRASGFDPRAAAVTSSVETTLGLVSAGAGVALVPQTSLADQAACAVATGVLTAPRPALVLQAAWLARAVSSPARETFLESLAAVADTEPRVTLRTLSLA